MIILASERLGDRSTSGHTNCTFTDVFTYLRPLFPVLSMLLVSSNHLTHIQILFVSWTAFLCRIMILHQKALWARSQICCYRNTPVSKCSMFICPNHNRYWDGVNDRSEQNYIHSPTPTTARVLPLPNCLVLSAAPCIIFTSTMIKIYT